MILKLQIFEEEKHGEEDQLSKMLEYSVQYVIKEQFYKRIS